MRELHTTLRNIDDAHGLQSKFAGRHRRTPHAQTQWPRRAAALFLAHLAKQVRAVDGAPQFQSATASLGPDDLSFQGNRFGQIDADRVVQHHGKAEFEHHAFVRQIMHAGQPLVAACPYAGYSVDRTNTRS